MDVDRCKKMVSLRIVTLISAAVLYLFIPLGTLGAEEYDFWVQTPTDWVNKTEGLGNDLKKQVMSPAGDAFIEVYAAKGTNIGVQAIADGMEQAMRQRDTAYLQNRISSRNIQADGQPAILREYTGQYNGLPLRAYALYAYGNGGRFAVFGVFVAGQSAKYQQMLHTCVTSLRFSAPGQPSSGQAASTGSPYGGGGSPYGSGPDPGCGAIVGKWKWFTGSTAEFGPNGHIPGQGHHWECLDNGKTFKISWNNGQWVDTLTLSDDGSRMEGKNQVGNRVWGTRISPPPSAGSSGSGTDTAGTGGSTGGGSQSGGASAPQGRSADTTCCSYFGLWNFVPPGIHGVFMPDHHYTEQSQGLRYDCSGGQVTIHWKSGNSTTYQRKSPQLMTRTDKWGNVVKATRIRDWVDYEGKRYTACTGTDGQVSGGQGIPSVNRTREIDGNMAVQWGFAHGSLKPNDPSSWQLSTVSGVTLNFLDPYKQGKQRYRVTIKNGAGTIVSDTSVGMSATVNLPPGDYTIDVTTDIHYAGWRCEWKK